VNDYALKTGSDATNAATSSERVAQIDPLTGLVRTRKRPYRILVTGSRDWNDGNVVSEAMLRATDHLGANRGGPVIIVVHGACPTGADAIADRYASMWGWRAESHPANWDDLGRSAGPLRNRHMVELGADVCLAFIKNASRGATHCARLAEKAGIPVRYWREP